MRRIAAVLFGWLLAVPAFLLALALCFAMAAWMVQQPGYWVALAVSPFILVGAPAVVLLLLILTAQLSALPVLALATLTEVFGLRSAWLWILSGAAVAGGYYVDLTPRPDLGLSDEATMVEAGLFCVAGASAGLIYWLVAGRRAGLRPKQTAAP